MQPTDRIEIEKDYDQTRWVLPFRDLGKYSGFGWVLVALGIFVTLFMLTWISIPLYMGVKMIGEKDWFGWFPIAFSLVGLSGLFFALRISTLGFRLIKNRTRSEILIAGEKLYSIEKLGWFDWKRKIKLQDVLELQIKDASSISRNNSHLDFGSELGALVAKTSKKSFLIAAGYANSMIAEIANQLSQEFGKSVASSSNEAHPGVMERESKGSIPVSTSTGDEKIPELPASSKIVMQDHGEHRAYEVPPSGFKGVAGFLLFFSSVWILFCVGVSVSLWMKGEIFQQDWEGGIVLVCFTIVGLAMLTCAFYLAKRSMMIGILGDQLFLERKSLFGTKWVEIAVTEIDRIYVGDSNMEVNDKPIRELKIEVNGESKPQGYLSQLEEDELDWLAYSLSQDLGINSLDDDEVHWQDELRGLGAMELPPGSPIRFEERVDGVQINVPRKMGQLLGAVCFGFVFLAISILIGWFNLIGNFDLFAIGFVLVFGFVGLAIVFFGLEFGTRRFEFETENRNLTARRYSLFASKYFEFHRDEIKSIDIGFSGIKTNNKKSFQLQIRAGEKSFNGMTHWSKLEISVVAGKLNQSLKLDRETTSFGKPSAV